jgi:hypothetical protein
VTNDNPSDAPNKRPAKSPKPGRDAQRANKGALASMTPEPRRGFDRVVAIALLVVGLFSIFGSLSDYLSLPLTLNRLLAELHKQMPEFAQMTYTDKGLAQPMGMIMITVEGLIFGLTVWLTVRRISDRKLAFWVPIVGWAVTSILVFAGQLVCLVNDPMFVHNFLAAAKALDAGTMAPSPTVVPTTLVS